jgi:hypothetical protein
MKTELQYIIFGAKKYHSITKITIHMRGGTMTIQNGLKLDLRAKPDLRIQLIKHLVTASWVLAVAAFFITCLSLPASKIFLNDSLKLNLPTGRDPLWMAISLGSIAATFLASIIGAYLNSTRNRRRGDYFYKSLTVIGILSGISIIVYLALV